jgi:DNA-binding transcriptional LysR family regulator
MSQALKLDRLRTFVAIAEAGSFRAAARRLSRVQSAISYAIAGLEAELGVALFDRAGHRPALTGEGRALLEDARAILLRVDRMHARAQGLNEGVELSLSLVADPIFPVDRLAAVLKKAGERFPTLRLRLAIEALGAPLTALHARRADLSIVVGEEFRHPSVELEALTTVSMCAVAAARHPLAARAGRIGVADLAEHLQIVLEDPSAWTEGRDLGVISPETWTVQGQTAKHALILAGTGWGRLPLWLIERDLDEGRLVRLDAPALGPGGASPLTAYLARRNDRTFGPAARAIRDLLRSRQPTQGRRGRKSAERPTRRNGRAIPRGVN